MDKENTTVKKIKLRKGFSDQKKSVFVAALTKTVNTHTGARRICPGWGVGKGGWCSRRFGTRSNIY